MSTNLTLTRRCDQIGFSPAYHHAAPAADQLIGGVIVCQDAAARDAWVDRLNRRHRLRFNYFVFFKDARGPAVMFGHAPWASIDCPSVQR